MFRTVSNPRLCPGCNATSISPSGRESSDSRCAVPVRPLRLPAWLRSKLEQETDPSQTNLPRIKRPLLTQTNWSSSLCGHMNRNTGTNLQKGWEKAAQIRY